MVNTACRCRAHPASPPAAGFIRLSALLLDRLPSCQLPLTDQPKASALALRPRRPPLRSPPAGPPRLKDQSRAVPSPPGCAAAAAAHCACAPWRCTAAGRASPPTRAAAGASPAGRCAPAPAAADAAAARGSGCAAWQLCPLPPLPAQPQQRTQILQRALCSAPDANTDRSDPSSAPPPPQSSAGGSGSSSAQPSQIARLPPPTPPLPPLR